METKLERKSQGEEKKENKVIAIDGKTLCGSIGNNLKGMAHMLHAWSVENGLCLGQEAVKDKSNEVTAMVPLLKMLDLKGCIITADAIHSHKETAKAIVEQEGDYVLPINWTFDNSIGASLENLLNLGLKTIIFRRLFVATCVF